MLGRKNSLAAGGGIGGEPSFVAAGAGVTDYGPDETLSEGNDVTWASRFVQESDAH